MTDAAFPDRVTQLRAKWEADPTSRVFLQLGEEYRHLGRVKEALAVLEKGLKEHPGYLSALVAKGRCHLELGEAEAARAVLERVVKQDATQMVANKLLVRAYLGTGEPGKARERLDLYSLLNDSDPEIEELRRRIKAMDRPAPAEEPRRMDADPFSLEPPVPRREINDVFDIDPAPPSPGRAGDDIFSFAPPPALAAVRAPVRETREAREEPAEEPDGLLFPGLVSGDSRRRYLEGLAAEGLFAFEAPEAAPPPAESTAAPMAPMTVDQVVDESAWLEETEVTPPPPAQLEPEEAQQFFAPVAPAQPSVEEDDLWGEASAPPAATASETEPAATATATLGELYLRQGHLAEAEQIFREVLQHEPDHAPARAGLAHLASLAEPEPARLLDAGQLLSGFQPAPGQTGVTARKIYLLKSYLKRLRGESAHHVS